MPAYPQVALQDDQGEENRPSAKQLAVLQSTVSGGETIPIESHTEEDSGKPSACNRVENAEDQARQKHAALPTTEKCIQILTDTIAE